MNPKENISFIAQHNEREQFYVLLIFVLFYSSISFSQNTYEKSFYGGLFYISDYIASQEFIELKAAHTDLQLVDSIYVKALHFFEGDYSETFLCLTFATLPFEHIKFRLPIFGSQVNIPLPSPGKNKFEARTKNLPKYLFIDSPQNSFGDKDKLAHFFGNAFLSYNFGWFNFSKFMGIFVEKVEDGFFIEGQYDIKDLVINNYGEVFGKAVKNKTGIKPSNILKIYQLKYLRLY